MNTTRSWRPLIAMLGLCLLLFGCGRASGAPRYFAYLDAPFSVSLRGRMDDLAFTALLESEGRAQSAGAVLPTACDFTLTYLSPSALAGIKVRYTAATDEISLSLGTLTAAGEDYRTLAAPGLLLLSESAVQRTCQNADGTLSYYTVDGACRTAASDGRPLSLLLVADGHRLALDLDGG